MAGKVNFGSGLLVLALVLAMNASLAMGAITCQQAIPKLLPCQKYLVGASNSVTIACCQGVKFVNDMADTTASRRELCTCLKNTARVIGVNPEKAKALPSKCGVTPRVPIDPNVDCNRVPRT